MSLMCFFAHHRCGSSWTNDTLHTICVASGWRHRTVHNAKMFDHDLYAYCATQRPDLLTLSNANWQHTEKLPDFLGVHLVRDPRDVLVSSYFSHCYSHPTDDWPELASHREELLSVDEEDGLLIELECREQQFSEMACWEYADPRILEWRLEDLVQAPEAKLRDLFSFWERLGPDRSRSAERARQFSNRLISRMERSLPGRVALPHWKTPTVSPHLLGVAQQKNSYRHKSGGRAPGTTKQNHHYRSGVAGDWRKHFTPMLAKRFNARYGSLLLKLGYEKNDSWC